MVILGPMWFLFALAAAWLQASHRLLNQYRQMQGIQLTFVVKILVLIYVIPFLFFVEWPGNPLFYAMTSLTGIIAVYQDKSLFDFTARFGAGAVTRFEPLSVPIAFLAWTALHPDLLEKYLSRLDYFLGICACIAGSVFFARRLRHCRLSREAARSMLPLIFTLATMTVLTKTAIDAAPGYGSVAVYAFIQSAIVVVLSGLWNRSKGHVPFRMLRDKTILKTAIPASLLMLEVLSLRITGMQYAANPAYVTAVMLTGPFWILLFYKIVKHKEEGDIHSGIGIVFSALLLAALVAASGL